MKKKPLTITGLVVLLLAIGGYWGYHNYFKPDPVIQQQLYTQFGADFFNTFPAQTEIAGNTGLKTDNSQTKTVPDKPAEESGQTVTSAGDKGSGQVEEVTEKPAQEGDQTPAAPSSVNVSIPAKQITEQDIVNKYMPQLTGLQNLALSRLSSLYAAAKNEYVQEKQAGKLNTAALAQKYLQAGNMLEANVDSQFYGILNVLQAELVAKNLPTDQISVIKNQYEKAKAAERSQLLSKVLK